MVMIAITIISVTVLVIVITFVSINILVTRHRSHGARGPAQTREPDGMYGVWGLKVPEKWMGDLQSIGCKF